MTPDLKADLLERIVTDTMFHNQAETEALRARLKAATITEPPVSKEEKNPRWPRAVVNNALDLLEIRALNAGDVALAQHARQVLEEMSDPMPQAPPPDPCVVKCGNMSTCRDEPHLCIRAINLSRAYITREEAAALIPALQAFVAEGGAA